MPSREAAFRAFVEALRTDEIVVERVNSDADVMALLDHKAELKLRTPCCRRWTDLEFDRRSVIH
jgi:hypothetical protein